jgi:hypothetical protein
VSGYYTITNADNGKVLGFPLLTSQGGSNNFNGATAQLKLRDQNGNLYTRSMVFNPVTVEWEYSVAAGEFPIGRFWAMVAVTFPNLVGPIYSSEVIFDVVAAD